MLQAIIDRLNEVVPEFKGRAAGAAQLVAALAGPVTPPSAFVMLVGEGSSRNEYATGAFAQRVVARFGVVLVVRNVSDVRGAAAVLDLEGLRTAVMGALLNWQPSAAHDPVEHVTGRLDNYDDQTLWWIDEFSTIFYRST